MRYLGILLLLISCSPLEQIEPVTHYGHWEGYSHELTFTENEVVVDRGPFAGRWPCKLAGDRLYMTWATCDIISLSANEMILRDPDYPATDIVYWR